MDAVSPDYYLWLDQLIHETLRDDAMAPADARAALCDPAAAAAMTADHRAATWRLLLADRRARLAGDCPAHAPENASGRGNEK